MATETEEGYRFGRMVLYLIGVIVVTVATAIIIYNMDCNRSEVIKTAIEWEAKCRMQCGHCGDHPAEKTRIRPRGD